MDWWPVHPSVTDSCLMADGRDSEQAYRVYIEMAVIPKQLIMLYLFCKKPVVIAEY